MVVLATAAAVIASQAIISGAFSLTMQAIQLGYSPRLKVQYTSARIIGQIYVPVVNWISDALCIGLVLGFGSSTNLAAAYGVAITTTMLITTILFYFVARRRWHWPEAIALPVAAFFVLSISPFSVRTCSRSPMADGSRSSFRHHSFPHAHLAQRPAGPARHLGDVCVPLEDLLPDLRGQRIRRVPGRRFTCRETRGRRSRSCTISSTTKSCTNRSSS